MGKTNSSFSLTKLLATLTCIFLVIMGSSLISAAEPNAPLSPAERKMIEAVEAQNHGWYTSARSLLDAAEALDPKVPGLNYQRAIQALGEGHLDEAAALARKGIATGQNVGDCHTLLGLMAMQAGDKKAAAEEFQDAIAANPDRAVAYYNYSEYLRENARPREAITQLDIAIRKDSKNPTLPLKKRLARLEAGDIQPLSIETQKALQQNPPPASWLITAGAIALKSGKIDEAIILLRNARTSTPPEIFTSLMADPFFRIYSREPALKEFYPFP